MLTEHISILWNVARHFSSSGPVLRNVDGLKWHCVVTNWRASEASETLSGVYKFELVRYIYMYMYGGTCAILVAHATHT